MSQSTVIDDQSQGPTWVHPPSRPSTARTPTGRPNSETEYAPGVVYYSMPQGGWLHLSREMNRRMPTALRVAGAWYEADTEYMLVVCAFPELFGDRERVLAEAKGSVRSSFPDRYTAWTGEPVTAEQSSVVARREFAVLHADDWLVTSASGDWCETVPKGMVGVTANKGFELRQRGAEQRLFLVPADEYEVQPNGQPFVVDPERHTTWEGRPNYRARSTAEQSL